MNPPGSFFLAGYRDGHRGGGGSITTRAATASAAGCATGAAAAGCATGAAAAGAATATGAAVFFRDGFAVSELGIAALAVGVACVALCAGGCLYAAAYLSAAGVVGHILGAVSCVTDRAYCRVLASSDTAGAGICFGVAAVLCAGAGMCSVTVGDPCTPDMGVFQSRGKLIAAYRTELRSILGGRRTGRMGGKKQAAHCNSVSDRRASDRLRPCSKCLPERGCRDYHKAYYR